MKVIFTESALRDLEQILAYLKANYPSLVDAFEKRVHAVAARLSEWPESAPAVRQRRDVRAALFIRYPYRLYYRVIGETIEIVRIRHTSRRPSDADL